MRLLFLGLFLVINFSLSIQKANYTGEWVHSNEFSSTILHLSKDGFFHIKVDGENFGGKEFLQDGLILESKYHIDSSTEPANIDLFFVEKESGNQIKHIKGIIEYINADKIKTCMNESGIERPTFFNSKSTKIFDRVIY